MITTLPLIGIKVLDLSRVLAGPFCTMMLGDLGADVVKIERPGTGDDTRAWGPPFNAHGESAYYLSTNRNKLSAAADLTEGRDLEFVRKLLVDADVVVDNFRPGVLMRSGLDPDALVSRHPHLIWCTISGFGEQSHRPGYDFVVQAESGWMAITGAPDSEPTKIGVALADVMAGKDAVISIVAALVARPHGARRLHVSLADSARSALINVAQNAMVSGAEARRWGNAHANLVPYQLFHAADRAIVIAVGTDQQWRLCANVIGLTQLASDSRLATNAGRLAHRDLVVTAMAQTIATQPADHWMRRLSDEDVPCAVVKRVLEVIAETAGASAETGMPSAVGGEVRRPPPRLDEHGALLRAQGWSAFAAG
ncbi:MAG TPA: CoA transferase [Gemmatimonadaceae bacterium]|nr:CoA transferase [Gemmatimonadaceae bacterium]